jgi:DNA-directed RNA polymerase subunit RPC12/RpoP
MLRFEGSRVTGDDLTVDELMQSILRMDVREVEPTIDLSRPGGFYYPLLEQEGLDPTSTEPLEALASRGDLERTVRYKLLTCPDDRSPHLRTVLLCPSCGSEDLKKEVLLEHFSCGHIGPEGEFQGEDGAVCPKCGKRLKLLGKDYRRPADFYRCGHCGEITYVPDPHLHCTHCGRYLMVGDAEERLLYSYLRREEKPSAFQEVISRAADVLENAGYDVSTLAEVEGRSGLLHRCDLYAWKEVSGLKTEVLMDVSIASKKVSSRPLVNLFAKGEDVGISNLLFVAIPALEETARGYAGFHGIKVLEAGPEEVHERLPEFLSEELFISRETEPE